MSCKFDTNSLNLKEQLHTKLGHCPRVFFGVFGRSYGGDWILFTTEYKIFYLRKSPRVSELLCPMERSRVFLQKPIDIAVELANYSN